MKQVRTTTRAPRMLRRTAACTLLALGLWLLSLTAADPPGAAIFKRLGESPGLITAALATHLAGPPGEGAQMTAETGMAWPQVLLSESPFLAGWNRGGLLEEAPPPEGEEEHENLSSVNPDKIVERSFQATAADGYAAMGDVYIFNRTSKTLDMAALSAVPVTITLPTEEAPQILIVHTHGSEAYAWEEGYQYRETDTARTTDTQYNIIKVGDEIERIFTEMGLSVLHDRNLYDYPSYNGAYDRSKAAVEQHLKDHPSIQLVLDVHRDALVGEDGTVYKPVTEIDGVKTAQVLMVIGSDDLGLDHPRWQENLALAMRIQHRLNTLWPGLSRPITLNTHRFNQQLSPGSILVEIGAHGNTLSEAMAGARLFARSAGQVFLELKQ